MLGSTWRSVETDKAAFLRQEVWIENLTAEKGEMGSAPESRAALEGCRYRSTAIHRVLEYG
jgi:hypothetical protein